MDPGKPTGSVRERLLQAADALFYEEGVHAVGIDRVLQRAGVAKASLYSAFGSKEELVRAYLQGRDERLRARITRRVEAAAGPRERILAVFEALSERVGEGGYRGCAFIRACAEDPAGPTAARQASAAHRAWRRDLFRRLAEELGARDPLDLARQLSLLYDGAATATAMDGDAEAPEAARRTAACLLDAAMARRPARPRRR